jgi:membrane fusion protein (multidrug efflux system)
MKRVLVGLTVGLVVLGAAGAGAYWYFVMRHAGQAGAGGPGGGGGGGEGGGGFEPSEAVQLVDARQVEWRPTADLVGTAFAIRSVTVRNELAGVVTRVGFESGSQVDPGAVLLQQDDTTEQADLRAAQAAVRVAEANVVAADAEIKLAELELERLSRVGSRAVAEVEVDRARSKLDTTKADRAKWNAEVDQARARVAQIEARLAKMTIKAPFKARVGMRTVHEGQYLAEGTDVVTLQEVTDKIYLDFAVAQEYAPRVAAGTKVMATGELLGPEPVLIEVVAMDAAVNYDTRNLRVRAVVDNSKGLLVPGMSVQVRVPIDEAKSFTVVPSTAVRRAAYANSVFVVGPDAKDPTAMRAHQKFVTLGPTIGEDVIVLDGLKPGEKIAAAGSFKLRDGVKVMLGPPGGPGAPGGPGGPGGGAGGGGGGPEKETAAAGAK